MTATFIRADHIGRPVFGTNTGGTKVWTAAYLPFGGVRTTTGTPITARFPGQWFQSESGLHQNCMRNYDPTNGRYLQADPLGLVDRASIYGYAGQSPLVNVDPTGQCFGPAAAACAEAVVACVANPVVCAVGAIIIFCLATNCNEFEKLPIILKNHTVSTDEPEPYVDEEGAAHIIDGHKNGAGKGKSEFPPGWGEDDIVDGVEGVAKNGTPVPGGANNPEDTYKEGVVTGPDGKDITIGVVIGPDGRITTGYPINPY